MAMGSLRPHRPYMACPIITLSQTLPVSVHHSGITQIGVRMFVEREAARPTLSSHSKIFEFHWQGDLKVVCDYVVNHLSEE
jgi:hypothetical protein